MVQDYYMLMLLEPNSDRTTQILKQKIETCAFPVFFC